MKKLFFLLLFFQQFLMLYAQDNIGIVTHEFREYDWHESKERFVLTKSKSIPSYFYFVDGTLYFKKGNNDWRQNELELLEKETRQSKQTCFMDNFGQFIRISKTKISFMFEFDGQVYAKKVDYYISRRDDELVQEKFEERMAGVTESTQFKRSFTQFSLYENGQWGKWQEGNNTIVFNYKNTSDIFVYFNNGKKEFLQNMSGFEKAKTKDGNSYQIATVLDDNGNELQIQLFDSGDVKFMYSNGFMIQLH
ncbi:hypothetical protein [Flammeovirga sp. SJP92]|uniref:hypothetical protein n=1 Tax=Flammeovirga sp. SJP92 TaxID=1775430 RepID=UPI00079160C8|nr:hypothetical protein [Flammeovirga sp. SJP92]KXX66682.1 hypothetical protein AVL50_31055 [Flammeovirga sp. SJP92]